jgi:hypothetical protein
VSLAGALTWCICPLAYPAEGNSVTPQSHGTIDFEGRRWEFDSIHNVSVEEYEGKTSLWVQGRANAYVHLPDAQFRDGSIEVDIAAQPRFCPGVGFRGRSDGQWCDKVMFGPARRSPMNEGSLFEQAVITRREGTLVLLRLGMSGEGERGKQFDLFRWFHVKIVVRGQGVQVYVDDSREPVIVADKILDDCGHGTVGVFGNRFYFANFHYTPCE